MRLNFRPQRVAFIDFETQSEAELVTARKYAKHPSTRVLCCVLKPEGGPVYRIGPYLGAEAKRVMQGVAATHTLVAHNAPFDAAVWEHTAGLPEAEWFDTVPCARAAGLPGGLDAVGNALTGGGKDHRGKMLIELLCKLKPGRVPPIGPAHKLLIDYCQRDVELLEQIYDRVKGYGEPDIMELDAAVNARGVPVDREFLCRIAVLYEQNSSRMRDEFERMTGGVSPTSPQQVKRWMLSLGFQVDSISKFALRDLMEDPDSAYVGDEDTDVAAAFELVRDAMEVRKEVARVGGSKAGAAIAGLEHDDRIRDLFVYWGAHTGRWTCRDLQLHNMPRPNEHLEVLQVEPELEQVQEAARLGTERARAKGLSVRLGVADVLGAMLRHMVRADNLLVADYGAVEARGTAFVARCTRMLDAFADPRRSVYLDMGRSVFGREISKKQDVVPYTLSKTLVLGCSYGMSWPKFENTCTVRGIDVRKFVDPAAAVKAYRETYPEIPAVWKAYGCAVLTTVRTRYETTAGRCRFRMHGSDLHCVLPSGRTIVYRNARLAMKEPAYYKLFGKAGQLVETVVFDKPRRGEGFLYGSKVCENVVQGMCRDLLAYAMLCCEQEGLCPVLHVHDELVCAAPPSKLERFMQIMSTPPAWAEGFPILAEGYSGPLWTKTPRGYTTCDMLLGRRV